MKGKKGVVVVVHTKPDADCFFATALLKRSIDIVGYQFLKGGDEVIPAQINFKNVRIVDRGRRDLDHHGNSGVTSTDLAAKELGISQEKWIQPILKFVRRADLKGESQPFDIAELGKSLAHEESLTDDERMTLGVRMAEAILYFHENNLIRDNNLVREVLLGFLSEKGQIPPRWARYCEQLANLRFERPCDLVEILTAEKTMKGEDEAKRFGKELLERLFLDFARYIAAKEEIKTAKKIPVRTPFGSTFIIVGTSNNPKFNVAAREAGAIAVIQRNSNGHIQIYFDQRRIKDSPITRKIIAGLRMREIQINKITLEKRKSHIGYITQPGAIEECKEWYYFVGEKEGVTILNGSLTAPEVPVTKLSLEEIIEIVRLCLAT